MDELISRQAVLELPRNLTRNMRGKVVEESIDVELIEALPPARPKRKTGNWIYGEDRSGQDGWFCSECRFFVPWYYGYNKNIDFIRAYKTCPCCDAKMISYTGKDEENATD